MSFFPDPVYKKLLIFLSNFVVISQVFHHCITHIWLFLQYHTVTSFITFFALMRSIFHYYLLFHSIFNKYMYQTINPLLNIFFWSLAIRKTPYWPPPYLSFHITNASGNACKGICLVMYNKESERCVLRYFYFERMKLFAK